MQIYDIPIDSTGRETTAHGTFAFPMAVYETLLRKNVLGFVSWHWHQEFQFCLVTAGAVEFYVQRQQLRLEAGQGLFINSNILHMARPLCPEAAYCCIDVLPSLLSGFPGSLLDMDLVTPLSADPALPYLPLTGTDDGSQRGLDLLRQVRQFSEETPPGYQLAAAGLLMALLQVVLSQGSVHGSAAPEDFIQLRSVLEFIHSRYAEKLTLSQCAVLANLSPSEFSRRFKSIMHCTLTDYIRQVRIQRSAALLQDPARSISQIAYECGFSTTSYFISQFRQATGLTPLRYRQTHIGG